MDDAVKIETHVGGSGSPRGRGGRAQPARATAFCARAGVAGGSEDERRLRNRAFRSFDALLGRRSGQNLPLLAAFAKSGGMAAAVGKLREVKVHGLAPSIPLRLLGEHGWQAIEALVPGTRSLRAELESEEAADLAARLRNLCLLGQVLAMDIRPPLSRPLVRRARLEDARRRRQRTPGFLRSGAKMDEEGRYSLTPEALALKLARINGTRKVIDAGCGVGGNSIAFARVGAEVLGIELDPGRAKMARANAKLYGVSSRLEIRSAEAESLIPIPFDGLIFCDPPWGRDWKQEEIRAERFPLAQWLWEQRTNFDALWLKLPPAFDPSSLGLGSLDLGSKGVAIDAIFGEESGDERRIKFILIRYEKEPRRLTRLA